MTTMMDHVTTGPLKIDVDLLPSPGLTRCATARAAGYEWTVIADEQSGAPRVRVYCSGRPTTGPFARWNYPRADMWAAVGRAVVAEMTGARAVVLESTGGPYVGRSPVAESTRNDHSCFGRFFLLTDIF